MVITTWKQCFHEIISIVAYMCLWAFPSPLIFGSGCKFELFNSEKKKKTAGELRQKQMGMGEQIILCNFGVSYLKEMIIYEFSLNQYQPDWTRLRLMRRKDLRLTTRGLFIVTYQYVLDHFQLNILATRDDLTHIPWAHNPAIRTTRSQEPLLETRRSNSFKQSKHVCLRLWNSAFQSVSLKIDLYITLVLIWDT